MITQHIIAEGHHLGMVVTMKGYTAIIVDIKSSFFQKKKKLLSSRHFCYVLFSSEKKKNIYGDYAVGHHVTSLTGVHNR